MPLVQRSGPLTFGRSSSHNVPFTAELTNLSLGPLAPKGYCTQQIEGAAYLGQLTLQFAQLIEMFRVQLMQISTGLAQRIGKAAHVLSAVQERPRHRYNPFGRS